MSPKNVADFLGAIEIYSEARGNQETLSPLTVEQVFEKIAEFDGIGIGAHVDSNKGITEDMRGVQRTLLIQSNKINALEIINRDTKTFFDARARKRAYIRCTRATDDDGAIDARAMSCARLKDTPT